MTFNNTGVDLGSSTARAMGLTGTGVSTSEAGAITSNRYFTFTVTADPGQMISLERLTMNANLGGANSAPDFSIRIDTGSGFSTVATGSITATSGSSGSPSNAIDLSFTEPAPGALSNLTGTVTFQLAFYNLSATPTGWADWVRMDDISVIGTVEPVPEAGVALLSVAGAAAGLVRRRR